MAFTNSIRKYLAGMGSGSQVFSDLGDALTATKTVNLTTSNLANVQPFSNGMGRIRLSSPAASTTCQVTVQVTDGTTTEDVFVSPVSAAGHALDFVFDFVTDLAANAINIVYTLAGAATTGTADAEIVVNP